MSLWVDKYRPTALTDLDFHLEQATQLKKLVGSSDFPHLLVFGPSGAGKKTRVACVLRELYGVGAEKLRIESRTFEPASGKRIELTVLSSNYHVEINPSDVGIYDRVVVQELIKTMAQTQQLDASGQKDFKVVLNEVDRLSKDAQHALRRTMEKYSASCRLILCCRSISKVIAPVRSRCLAVRVAAPTNEEIVNILLRVAQKEKAKMPEKLAERVAQKSDGNLRRALLLGETCFAHSKTLTENEKIFEPDWEVYLRETASMMLQEQSPKRILEIRSRLNELLIRCIPTDIIFKGLVKEILRSCDGHIKAQIVAAAAECEHRLQLGTKPIFHLEHFVARFMSIYKKFLESTLGDFA